MDITDIIIALNQRRGKRSWVELAAEIGVSPQHLCEILKGRRPVRGKVLAYLGLMVEETYVKRSETWPLKSRKGG